MTFNFLKLSFEKGKPCENETYGTHMVFFQYKHYLENEEFMSRQADIDLLVHKIVLLSIIYC